MSYDQVTQFNAELYYSVGQIRQTSVYAFYLYFIVHFNVRT